MTMVGKTVIISEQSIRQARLGSGLIMFAFVVLHLLNHTLGLISPSVADRGRDLFLAIWRNPIGTLAFYLAALIHITLVLRSIYLRRSLVMPKSEAAQILFGLLIPLLLIDHVIGTRITHALFGIEDNYETVVRSLWITTPMNGLRQAVALVIVWSHGCIGLHFWLRYRPWYQRAAPSLLTLAILLPVLALLGFIEMGRTLADPSFLELTHPEFSPAAALSGLHSEPDAQATLAAVRAVLYGSFSLAVAAVLLGRVRRDLKGRMDLVNVHYPGGEVVRVMRGNTVLEASRQGGLQHYSVCGGKGRCSTCRIQIISDYSTLQPPDKLELSTLKRINAAPDVRLACQLRPDRDITVAPLLVPRIEVNLASIAKEMSPGREREIAVLFCDIRRFTTLTERRLPFDVVFLLNRYFAVIGNAVERAGGQLDKFIGDGAMALFGLDVPPDEACKQAIAAATTMVAEIEKLSAELTEELNVPLQIAIGIHTGPAVVGTMGYGKVRSLTAIGDTVNLASRMETAAKDLNAAIVASEAVAIRAGFDTQAFESCEIDVRGRTLPMRVYVISRGDSARVLNGNSRVR